MHNPRPAIIQMALIFPLNRILSFYSSTFSENFNLLKRSRPPENKKQFIFSNFGTKILFQVALILQFKFEKENIIQENFKIKLNFWKNSCFKSGSTPVYIYVQNWLTLVIVIT